MCSTTMTPSCKLFFQSMWQFCHECFSREKFNMIHPFKINIKSDFISVHLRWLNPHPEGTLGQHRRKASMRTCAGLHAPYPSPMDK